MQPRLMPVLAAFLALASLSIAQQTPPSNHVVIITEENHSFEQVIGNPNMPYFNQLAQQYGLALQYYATCHNSITALMWLTAGAPVTTDDNTRLTFNVDNIVRHLLANGKTWKSYAEGLPYVGYDGFNVGEYVKRHNPLAYFSDVADSQVQVKNLVPLEPYLQQDIANDTLPNYSYVVPNLEDDEHDGTDKQADQWLAQHVPALLNNRSFQQDGLLFIVFDEGSLNPLDTRGIGGRIAVLAIGPHVLHGSRSSQVYNHQSMLRTVCNALELSGCPGGGKAGVPMEGLWGTEPVVQIQTPASGVNVGTPFELMADLATTVHPATALIAYSDNTEIAKVSGGQMDLQITLPVGQHHLVVNGWDSSGKLYQSGEFVTVLPTFACPSPKGDPSVTLCLPPGMPQVPRNFEFKAFATDSAHPITAMIAYVDNKAVSQVSGNRIDVLLSLSAGEHHIVVNAWDTTSKVYQSGQYVIAQ